MYPVGYLRKVSCYVIGIVNDLAKHVEMERTHVVIQSLVVQEQLR